MDETYMLMRLAAIRDELEAVRDRLQPPRSNHPAYGEISRAKVFLNRASAQLRSPVTGGLDEP